jgi:hypothetical protein
MGSTKAPAFPSQLESTMTIKQASPQTEEEVSQASDIEQKTGHGGNLRDSRSGDPLPKPVIGSSGHIPGSEVVLPSGVDDQSASPGADADRDAAR